MNSSVSPKDEIWFLCVCRHISDAVYNSGCVYCKNRIILVRRFELEIAK